MGLTQNRAAVGDQDFQIDRCFLENLPVLLLGAVGEDLAELEVFFKGPVEDFIPWVTETLERPLTTMLSNNFGFGGTNASLVLRRIDSPSGVGVADV